MEIQKIACADFILFKGGKDSIALEETYPWYCSFMADFYNDLLIIASIFPKVNPIYGKIVYGVIIFSLPVAIFWGLRYKAVEYICDFAFSRSGMFVIPIIVEIITMLIIVPIVLLIGCAKLMRLKLF